jgi:hypothetical protein
MRALCFAAALLAASPAWAVDTPGKPSTDAKHIVRIDGDTLIYIGGNTGSIPVGRTILI